MITKTITSHDVYNYGASLQAFSLQQFLVENCCQNEIIDYKPVYSRARYNFWYISPRYKFSNCKLLWLPVCLFLARKRFKTYKRKQSFDRFTKKYLRLTSKRYYDYNSLQKAHLKADVVIVGSEQVWNSDHINGRDHANYLAFVNGGKKISYAASFGMDHIREGYEEMVREHLSSFDAITVRESHAISILRDIGLEGTQVVDPTMLHGRTWWEKYCKDAPAEDYLLVYDFGQSDMIKKVALRIAHERGLKIYSINDFTTHHYADMNINDAGPLEFISLIRGAKYFVSNSFHGTIFSMIFEIPFLVIKRTQGDVNSRMESLLQMVGLEDRLLGDMSDLERIEKVDYVKVKEIIGHNASQSSNYFLSLLK